MKSRQTGSLSLLTDRFMASLLARTHCRWLEDPAELIQQAIIGIGLSDCPMMMVRWDDEQH